MSLRSGKKRKESDDWGVRSSSSIKVVENDAALVAPPDDSKFSPVQKILLIDIIMDDSNAVRKALSKLALLFVDEDEADDNRAIADRVGGASILSAVLRKWYAFPSIQAEGCRALQNMSCNNTDLLGPIKDSGGLDAIIWAMNTYADNQNVQTTACGALSNLFIGKDTSDYLVEELDGVHLIIAAMNTFPNDAELQKRASWALDNLTCWDEFKDVVKQAGGRRALLDAIEIHQDERKEHVKELQQSASDALKKLLRDN